MFRKLARPIKQNPLKVFLVLLALIPIAYGLGYQFGVREGKAIQRAKAAEQQVAFYEQSGAWFLETVGEALELVREHNENERKEEIALKEAIQRARIPHPRPKVSGSGSYRSDESAKWLRELFDAGNRCAEPSVSGGMACGETDNAGVRRDGEGTRAAQRTGDAEIL